MIEVPENSDINLYLEQDLQRQYKGIRQVSKSKNFDVYRVQ